MAAFGNRLQSFVNAQCTANVALMESGLLLDVLSLSLRRNQRRISIRAGLKASSESFVATLGARIYKGRRQIYVRSPRGSDESAFPTIAASVQKPARRLCPATFFASSPRALRTADFTI
jgi:hypothetical protein